MSSTTSKLIAVAETVKSESLYDIRYSVSSLYMYRLMFDKDREDEVKVCKNIYKYKK